MIDNIEILCLGNNCEMALQLKRLGYDESNFFRYTYCPFESLVKILKTDFKNIFRFENLVPIADGMIQDKQFGISFHSEMKSYVENGRRFFSNSYQERKKIYDLELDKIQYLVHKWFSALESDKKKVFLIKPGANELLNNDNFKFIEDYLNSKNCHNYEFFLLLDKSSECIVNRRNVKIHILDSYAPDTNVLEADERGYENLMSRLVTENQEKIVKKISYNPKLPLISLHLPKTAGTSFQRVLEQWFSDRLLFHYTDYYNKTPPKHHNILDSTGAVKSGICIHGHFAHNEVFDFYGDYAKQFISILREPFEAHASLYFYIKGLGDKAPADNPMAKKISMEGYNLKDFFEDFPESNLLWFFYPGMTLENYQEIIDEKFLFIGTTERLKDSVDMLANLLGKTTVNIPRWNTSSWDENVEDRLRSTFSHNNPLATSIYDYVNRKFLS